jgi:PAS domain S-box-containing protein
MSVPIELADELFGILNVQRQDGSAFTVEERRLLLSLAQRGAVALDNARLFEGQRLALERLEVAVAAGSMGTWELDLPSRRINWSPQLEKLHGLEPGTFKRPYDPALADSDIHPDDRAHVRQAIADSLRSGDHEVEYRIVWPDGSIHWLSASGRVIRDATGEPIGMRGVCQDITSRKLAEAEQARLVALEERQRLARELHDSVSQALYGIALGTQTIAGALEEDSDSAAAKEATRYVLQLTEAAIAEMRALIFELRPESLAREGLVAALERQADSLRARHGLMVETQLAAEPELPLERKEALYRIGHEALHNALKHAHAKWIGLQLTSNGDGVVLQVADDGIGFDPHMSFPGHLGLTSMRERADLIGATLSIHSQPGRGTRITVRS